MNVNEMTQKQLRQWLLDRSDARDRKLRELQAEVHRLKAEQSQDAALVSLLEDQAPGKVM